jgi:hypothetical protein
MRATKIRHSLNTCYTWFTPVHDQTCIIALWFVHHTALPFTLLEWKLQIVLLWHERPLWWSGNMDFPLLHYCPGGQIRNTHNSSHITISQTKGCDMYDCYRDWCVTVWASDWMREWRTCTIVCREWIRWLHQIEHGNKSNPELVQI